MLYSAPSYDLKRYDIIAWEKSDQILYISPSNDTVISASVRFKTSLIGLVFLKSSVLLSHCVLKSSLSVMLN